jgi:hypothetical protein
MNHSSLDFRFGILAWGVSDQLIGRTGGTGGLEEVMPSAIAMPLRQDGFALLKGSGSSARLKHCNAPTEFIASFSNAKLGIIATHCQLIRRCSHSSKRASVN